jgi:hypothetical protein
MINIYKYLYFKIYSFGIKLPWPNPKIQSVLALLTFEMLNYLMIIRILLLNGIKIRIANKIEMTFIVASILFIFNYLYLVHNNRYKLIYESYKHETNRQRFWGSVLVLIYMVGSFIVFIITATIPLPC